MSDKIVVPVLGESITEATVAKWLKNKGDSVEADEPVVELETDKVNLEVPSPSDGVLSEINAQNGSTVEVGAVLGSIIGGSSKKDETENEPKEEKKVVHNEDNIISLKKEVETKEVETKLFDKEEKISEPNENTSKEEPLILTEEVSFKKEKSKKTKDVSVSPAVRKIAADNKIDLKKIQGTGRGGRVSKGDLLSLMNIKPGPSERKIKFGQEEKIKMTRLRQTIAKRLKQAQDNAAMLTTFNEVDMSGIIDMRKENQSDFQDRFGIKLGFMSFFVKACIESLKLFPAINAEIEGENIIYKNYYNISFAVGTEKGLVVPVLKNADEMSFADIEKKIKELSDKARDGKITIDDLQGGTFTISNGGVYGSMLSTPILNLPQSGVLGMHKIGRAHV